MKPHTSIVIAAAVLLATPATTQAETRTPSIVLRPLTIQAASLVTPQSNCEAPATIDDVPYFEMPAIAAEQAESGTTELRVDLTATGNLAGAGVLSSSGNKYLDAEALRLAHFTRFSAEVTDCKRVSGSYRYVVKF